MSIAGWGLAFAFLAAFVALSFPTWIAWWSARHFDVDDLDALSDEWKAPR